MKLALQPLQLQSLSFFPYSMENSRHSSCARTSENTWYWTSLSFPLHLGTNFPWIFFIFQPMKNILLCLYRRSRLYCSVLSLLLPSQNKNDPSLVAYPYHSESPGNYARSWEGLEDLGSPNHPVIMSCQHSQAHLDIEWTSSSIFVLSCPPPYWSLRAFISMPTSCGHCYSKTYISRPST